LKYFFYKLIYNSENKKIQNDRENCEIYLNQDYPISSKYKNPEYIKKKGFARSSSMQDLFDKTEENKKPYSKFTDMKFPPSKIFSGLPETPNKKGVKKIALKNECSNNNVNEVNEISMNNEIRLHNIKNQK